MNALGPRPSRAVEELHMKGPLELRSTLPFGQEEPPRATLPFGPLEMPDVRPVVIRLDLDESIPEAPSIVDSLKDEVDAASKPAPRKVVLTDSSSEVEARSSPPLLGTSAIRVLGPGSSPPSPVPPGASPPSPIPVAVPPRLSPPTPVPSRPVMSAWSPMPSAEDEETQMPSLGSLKGLGRGAASSTSDAWNWSASPPTRGTPMEGLAPPPTARPSPVLSAQASSAWDVRGNPGIRIEDMLGPDHTLELVSPSAKAAKSPDSVRVEVGSLLAGARDLMDLDDHTGAMELIAKAQAIAPEDPEVQALREKSERTLLAMFESKLGGREIIPRVMLKDDEIIWLNLDHRAGFVLAQIDGTVSFDDLFAVSGMSRLDTARILAQLMDEGVISGTGR